MDATAADRVTACAGAKNFSGVGELGLETTWFGTGEGENVRKWRRNGSQDQQD
ncbi:unnamed protein product [Dovyalis caffra]|uniref:Uncharacterized protein n=1 Tax=Dovyalis caffra TaxID=77055 RepID=A0AAV1RAZ5_9ROSI|nr:unnamed protein product [Dovyalis caffra]